MKRICLVKIRVLLVLFGKGYLTCRYISFLGVDIPALAPVRVSVAAAVVQFGMRTARTCKAARSTKDIDTKVRKEGRKRRAERKCEAG